MRVEVTWGIYQPMINAYRDEDRIEGRASVKKLVKSVSHGVPAVLTEFVTLGHTLKKRAADILAYFDRPRTSNGPTEATNGRHERPPRTAASNTSANQPSDSGSSPTVSPAHSCEPEDSGRNYTLNYEEPGESSSSPDQRGSMNPKNPRTVSRLTPTGAAQFEKFLGLGALSLLSSRQ